MKKFTKVLETLQSELNIDVDFENIQVDLIEMVEETTNSDDVELGKELMKSYIEDNSTNINGLINDVDVFDFYLKYRNEFDTILIEKNHFDKSPESIGINNGLYDYVVESTKIGVQYLFQKMINENEN